MKILIKNELELTKYEKQQLRTLLIPLFTWSNEIKKRLYYSSKPKWRLLLYKDKDLIGSLSMVERKITHPCKLLITGIGNVAVKQEYQKNGYASQMLQFVNEFLLGNNFNLGLLFCSPDYIKLYEKAGYILINKPITFYNKSKLEKEETSLFMPLNLTPPQQSMITNEGLHIGRGTW